jgi:signal recognition particle subunit SRP54
MGMLPGMTGMAKAAEKAGFDDKMLKRQIALINSMTKKERANPDLLAASRKKRIAKGAGLEVSDLNKLLKQHQQMAEMMKKMGKGGMMKQAIKQMMGGGGDGGMPDLKNMDPAKLEAASKAMQQGIGSQMGGMPRGLGLPGGGLPSGLSGLFKKK